MLLRTVAIITLLPSPSSLTVHTSVTPGPHLNIE